MIVIVIETVFAIVVIIGIVTAVCTSLKNFQYENIMNL